MEYEGRKGFNCRKCDKPAAYRGMRNMYVSLFCEDHGPEAHRFHEVEQLKELPAFKAWKLKTKSRQEHPSAHEPELFSAG